MLRREKPPTSSPPPRLTSVTDTIRSEGLGWILRRLRYRTPHTATGRKVHYWTRKMLGWILGPTRKFFQFGYPTNMVETNTLYAFYDLQVAPVTFDASWFAVAADHRRKQLGLSHIHFIIIPGNFHGFREERAQYEASIDTATRSWRLHHVVLPLLTLTPCFSGYSMLPSRHMVNSYLQCDTGGQAIYPEHYEPGLPVSHHPSELLQPDTTHISGPILGTLQSPVQGLRYLKRWTDSRLQSRRLITITLRNYEFMKERNSNLSAWVDFARRLDQNLYLPVFILDTEGTLDQLSKELEGFEIFREASWNVPLRMSLYETSYLNLGVNNGPMFMCALNKHTRLLIFKLITASVPQSTEQLIASLGFEIGGQLPFGTSFQKLVWEDDTLPVIEQAFQTMVAAIEKETNLHD